MTKVTYDPGKTAWKQHEEDFLLENYDKLTAEEIGKELGRSKNAIHSRISKLELNRRPAMTFYHDRIVQFAKKGKSYSEIAKELGESTYAVNKYMKEKEIIIKQKAPTTQKLALMNGIEEPITLPEEGITLKQWFPYWYQTYRRESIREVSRVKYRNTFGNMCKQPIVDKKLEEITRGDAQNYLNWFGATHAKQTMYDHWQYIRSCFGDAVIDGHLRVNPFENLKPVFKEQNYDMDKLKRKKDEKKWLEMDEYTRFKYHLIFWLDNAFKDGPIETHQGKVNSEGNRLIHQVTHTAIFVALKTGARFSEVLGLTKDDVLVGSSEINIDKTWNYKEGGGFERTKNVGSMRKVFVDKETIMVLLKYMEWLDNFNVETEGEALFIQKGLNAHSSSYNLRLKIILRDLDIKPITMHKLRHTQASILIAKGVPIQLVAKRLGHTDTTMIRKVYGHLLKETEEDGNRMIAGLL